MSYQPLHTAEEGRLSEDHPPDYDLPARLSRGKRSARLDTADAGGSHDTEEALPAAGRPANYVYLSDISDIVGQTLHIDTDVAPLYGRFDKPEERDAAPSVYLNAQNIDVDLHLSGSKKAKIIVKTDKTDYGRTLVRIHNAAGPAYAVPTPFELTISRAWRSACIVALPDSFNGAITGACSLRGHLRHDATCVVADATKSRWAVQKVGTSPFDEASKVTDTAVHSNPAIGDSQDTADTSQNQSAVYVIEAPASSNSQDTGSHEQRKRRLIVYQEDWADAVRQMESYFAQSNAETRKWYIYYLLGVLLWILFISCLKLLIVSMSNGTWAIITFIPLGFSVIVPIAIVAETYSEHTYHPPVHDLLVS